MTRLFQLLTIFAVVSLPVPSQAQTTYHVDDDACPGPGTGTPADPFCQVQDAIDASFHGDTVIVQPGRYYENIHMLGKNITLRSVDPLDPAVVQATILDGSQPVDPDHASVVTFAGTEQPDCVLDGLTITGGMGTSLSGHSKGYAGGVNGSGSIATLVRCRIVSNHLTNGVYAYGDGAGVYDFDGVIDSCVISDNVAATGGHANDAHGAGIAYCDGVIRDTLIANNISDSYYSRGAGAYMCSALFERCTITGNRNRDKGGGLGNCSGTIRDCLISSNYAAEEGGGLYKFSGTIQNCIIRDNGWPISAGGGGCSDCSGAIIDSTFIGNNASGGWGGAVNTTNGTTLLVENCIFLNNEAPFGGAIAGRGVVTIVNSIFDGNRGWEWGGAVYAGGPTTILSSAFTANTAIRGGAIRSDGTITVQGCMFGSNEAGMDGGALECSSAGDNRIVNCGFVSNTAGISGSECTSGGAISVYGSVLSIIGSSFVANVAHSSYCDGPNSGGGGAVGVRASTTILVNTTIVANEASGGVGGAIHVGDDWTGGEVHITNSLVWGNNDDGGGGGLGPIAVANGLATVDYSVIENGWLGPGTGNIDADPLFVDADGADDIPGTLDDNLRLSAASPCIDAGSNSAVPLGVTTDLAGNNRFIDAPSVPDTGVGTPPIVDMGAYEFFPDCNNNGILDGTDIQVGTSQDCDANGNPDECDPDADGDGSIDACDPCPADNPNDTDADTVCDSADVCPGFDDLIDTDGDGVPYGCDPCPADNPDDSDGDTVCNSADICPGFDDGLDVDADGVPDGCDPCPQDNPNDTDGDGACDSDDPCPTDNPDDSDADGVCESFDVCPGFDDGADADGDGTPDGCDACPLDNPNDSDADGVCNSADICPGFDDAADGDADGQPDGCDPCPADNPDDSDGDTVCESADVCPGFDDRVDPDGDARPSGCDNCPSMPNTSQSDFDSNGVGDACEPPLAPAGDASKNRYVSFVPNSAATPVAYAVVHPTSGTTLFVGEPQTQPVSIVGLGVCRLTAAPVVRDWSDAPVVHATGCMIAPDESYEIRTTMDGVSFSTALVVATTPRPVDGRWWADIVGGFTGPGGNPPNTWTGPDGFVSGFDILAEIQAFSGSPFAPPVVRVDVSPEVPDHVGNGGDILRIVNAFAVGSGREYYPFNVPTAPGPQGQSACSAP